MDQNLIESYKEKMLAMYRRNARSAAVTQNDAELTQRENDSADDRKTEKLTPPFSGNRNDQPDTGKLQAIVTTVRSIYFLPNARVTIFTGTIDDKKIVASDITDENGKTKEFVLQTPSKSLSLDSGNLIRPYALYNMLVEADGYRSNIHLNIPVFSSVTSQQQSDMMLLETAGVDKGPQIFDEQQNYNL